MSEKPDEKQVEPGDIVTLKSGGHAMTVEFLDSRDATVIWFRDGLLMREKIAVISLKVVDYSHE